VPNASGPQISGCRALKEERDYVLQLSTRCGTGKLHDILLLERTLCFGGESGAQKRSSGHAITASSHLDSSRAFLLVQTPSRAAMRVPMLHRGFLRMEFVRLGCIYHINALWSRKNSGVALCYLFFTNLRSPQAPLIALLRS
jgi:hypothetical protein